MIDRTPLDNAKQYLYQYLTQHGYNPDKLMTCIFHSPDVHPSMSFIAKSNTVYCHACHTTADIVDVIAAIEGYPRGSKEAIRRAIEYAGTGTTTSAAHKPKPVQQQKKPKKPPLTWSSVDSDSDAMDYIYTRGFNFDGDLKTLKSFGVGYNSKYNCLIIPHDGDYYTARKIDAADKSERYRHNAAASVQLFNGKAIDTEPIIGLCEGAIDALSLICLGLPTVALGGAGTQTKFLERLSNAQPRPNVIIALDNDDAGKKAAAEIETKLKSLSINTIRLRLYGNHDANDAFINNREKLAAEIARAKKFLAEHPKPEEDTPMPSTVLPATPSPEHQSFNSAELNDLSDYSIAKSIIGAFSNVIKYNFSNGGKFTVYQPPIWRLLNKDAEMRIIIERFRRMLNPQLATDRELLTMLSKDNKINRIISMLRSFDEIYINNEDFNAHDSLLNVSNGILNIPTRTLTPHDGKYLFTRQANVAYNSEAECPDFDTFIKAILPKDDTRAAIQRFLGYCLTGSVAEEKALFVVGSGGNGKGTLFRSIMNVLGDFSVPIKIDALLAAHRTQDGQSATPEFNKLEHARLAIAEEVPKNRQLDAAQFKLLTGGDYLPIRRLHQEASVIRHVTHKLILSGNSLPQLSDPDDEGLQRRLMVVQFPVTFSDNDRDPLLKTKLSTPTARSAILNWLLDGYDDYIANGLTTSEDMDATKNKYLADNDLLTAFIEDYCQLDPDAFTSRKDIISHIKGHAPFELRSRPDKDLVALLAKHDGISYVRTKRGFGFKGISIITDDEY